MHALAYAFLLSFSLSLMLIIFPAADVFLWRNKKIAVAVLGGDTAIWVLFELLKYRLITLLCHVSMLTLAALFLWSNAFTFINKSPPEIPVVTLPEKCVLEFASSLRFEINRALAVLREITSGRELKKFLSCNAFICLVEHAAEEHVIAGFWVLSIMGNWCNFLTMFYIAFVLLHTVPVIYEKYEDKIGSFGEKATVEIKKQYAVFDEKALNKVLSQIPKGALKKKD